MKKFLRKYRRLLIFLLILGLIIVSIILQRNYSQTLCTDLVIKIKNKKQAPFIDENYVKAYLYKVLKTPVIGVPFSKIDMNKLEKDFLKNPYLKSIQVYRAKKTKIFIEIEQRVPMVCFLYNDGKCFFVDTQGVIMPNMRGKPVYVPIVSGYIEPKINFSDLKKITIFADNKVKNTLLGKLYFLVKKIEANDDLKGLIDQYYVDENKNLILISKVGDFKIFFGKMNNIENKITKLKVLFKEILPKKGWAKYSRFNFDYKNQIVAEIK